jgi:IS1 family transposase
VERLLCEKITLRGICRALRVSIRWLMDFMVARFAAAPAHLHVRPVTTSRGILIGCLAVEADELWSFMQKKANPPWLWIAMDKQTRQILAFHVGDRSRDSPNNCGRTFRRCIESRQPYYTDQYAAYAGVIPTARHNPLAKLARNTNHIERFDNTLRQRVSRLARSTSAFSKSVENRIGAIRYFIGHYNLTKAALLV